MDKVTKIMTSMAISIVTILTSVYALSNNMVYGATKSVFITLLICGLTASAGTLSVILNPRN